MTCAGRGGPATPVTGAGRGGPAFTQVSTHVWRLRFHRVVPRAVRALPPVVPVACPRGLPLIPRCQRGGSPALPLSCQKAAEGPGFSGPVAQVQISALCHFREFFNFLITVSGF